MRFLCQRARERKKKKQAREHQHRRARGDGRRRRRHGFHLTSLARPMPNECSHTRLAGLTSRAEKVAGATPSLLERVPSRPTPCSCRRLAATHRHQLSARRRAARSPLSSWCAVSASIYRRRVCAAGASPASRRVAPGLGGGSLLKTPPDGHPRRLCGRPRQVPLSPTLPPCATGCATEGSR